VIEAPVGSLYEKAARLSAACRSKRGEKNSGARKVHRCETCEKRRRVEKNCALTLHWRRKNAGRGEAGILGVRGGTSKEKKGVLRNGGGQAYTLCSRADAGSLRRRYRRHRPGLFAPREIHVSIDDDRKKKRIASSGIPAPLKQESRGIAAGTIPTRRWTTEREHRVEETQTAISGKARIANDKHGRQVDPASNSGQARSWRELGRLLKEFAGQRKRQDRAEWPSRGEKKKGYVKRAREGFVRWSGEQQQRRR